MLNGLYIGYIDKRHDGMMWYNKSYYDALKIFPIYGFINNTAFAEMLSLDKVREMFPVLVGKMIENRNVLSVFIYDEQADMYFTLDENNNLIRRCKPSEVLK